MYNAYVYFKDAKAAGNVDKKVEGVFRMFDSFLYLTPITSNCYNVG